MYTTLVSPHLEIAPTRTEFTYRTPEMWLYEAATLLVVIDLWQSLSIILESYHDMACHMKSKLKNQPLTSSQ